MAVYQYAHRSSVYFRLCLRDDLSEALGQRHGAGAEPGSALEGAAPSARQQHQVRHGGLPAVDTGALHHWAQTRGQPCAATVVVCFSLFLSSLPPSDTQIGLSLPSQISDNSILETMYKNHSNLETIFRIIDTDHSGQ